MQPNLSTRVPYVHRPNDYRRTVGCIRVGIQVRLGMTTSGPRRRGLRGMLKQSELRIAYRWATGLMVNLSTLLCSLKNYSRWSTSLLVLLSVRIRPALSLLLSDLSFTPFMFFLTPVTTDNFTLTPKLRSHLFDHGFRPLALASC